MRRFFGVAVASFLVVLASTLFLYESCTPPSAYAITFNPTFDSIMWNDPQSGYFEDGIWHHPLPDTNLAVVAWGFWRDSVGGTFVPSGSDTVPYSDIYDYTFRIPQGNYQFYIYPLYKPVASHVLLWEAWSGHKIDRSKTITFAASTRYFLVMLDTTNTWDFNTGYRNDGFQYMYYLADSLSNYWPSYTMDYYCGTRGVDSVEFEYHIDSAKAGLMYPVMCLQTFDVGIRVNIMGAMELAEWTIHEKD